jgi:anti-sigma factor RsiW
MSVTPEELAAFADGELEPTRQAEVAAAVAADPALAAQLEAHRALRERLGAHFAPIFEAPVPDRLASLVKLEPQVIDFAAAREKRERARTLPRWTWFAGPALAASLALAVFMPRGAGDGYASGDLAKTLDGQLVAAQSADAPTRILLSFRAESGAYCRAFAGEAQSGIACRDDAGWRLIEEAGGAGGQNNEYRMAGSAAPKVLERAQAMAAGPALDAAEERAARARGWR